MFYYVSRLRLAAFLYYHFIRPFLDPHLLSPSYLYYVIDTSLAGRLSLTLLTWYVHAFHYSLVSDDGFCEVDIGTCAGVCGKYWCMSCLHCDCTRSGHPSVASIIWCFTRFVQLTILNSHSGTLNHLSYTIHGTCLLCRLCFNVSWDTIISVN